MLNRFKLALIADYGSNGGGVSVGFVAGSVGSGSWVAEGGCVAGGGLPEPSSSPPPVPGDAVPVGVGVRLGVGLGVVVGVGVEGMETAVGISLAIVPSTS